MSSIVGFTISTALPEDRLRAVGRATDDALKAYPNLVTTRIEQGETSIELWGRPGLKKAVRRAADDSLLILVGTPHRPVSLDSIAAVDELDQHGLPWDGLSVLLHVSADGVTWRMWNDWLGCLPVFYANASGGRIASTLEPAVVSAADYSSGDFHMPGLASLLINGHYVSDWTLYRGMKTVPPDASFRWDPKGVAAKRVWSVRPSQDRWEASWDDLVDEMHDISQRSIADCFRHSDKWLLPLSSGLDSRLIAGVASDLGANVSTCSWGDKRSTDVIYSRRIAGALGLPWRHVTSLDGNLESYTQPWAALFGSSMHFHGMYMMAFFDSVASIMPQAPVMSGFLGAPSFDPQMAVTEADSGACRVRGDGFVHWSPDEVPQLLHARADPILQELAERMSAEVCDTAGAGYQRLLCLNIWNRQRRFTNFQLTLADYSRGVLSPFMSREYVRFWLSLPRIAVEGRSLWKAVVARHYGKLASIPGTYGSQPLLLTGKYLLKRKLARALPNPLRRKAMESLTGAELQVDKPLLQSPPEKALWPIYEVKDALSQIVDPGLLRSEIDELSGSPFNLQRVRKLQSIQTIAYRLRSNACRN